MAGTIRGTIRDSVTKTPISNSSIIPNPSYPSSCVNGAYTITTPGAATVAVTASAPTYTPQTAHVSVADGQTVTKNFLLVKNALRSAAPLTATKKAPAKKKTTAAKAKPAKKAKALKAAKAKAKKAT